MWLGFPIIILYKFECALSNNSGHNTETNFQIKSWAQSNEIGAITLEKVGIFLKSPHNF